MLDTHHTSITWRPHAQCTRARHKRAEHLTAVHRGKLIQASPHPGSIESTIGEHRPKPKAKSLPAQYHALQIINYMKIKENKYSGGMVSLASQRRPHADRLEGESHHHVFKPRWTGPAQRRWCHAIGKTEPMSCDGPPSTPTHARNSGKQKAL